MPVSEEQSAPGLKTSTGDRLGMVLRALAAAPPDAGTPQLLISQAVAAASSDGGLVCQARGGRLEVLASQGYPDEHQSAGGPLVLGDLTLPLTCAATTGEPVWLVSQADTAARFPRLVELVKRDERAYAALPLRADGVSLGVLGISFARRQDFTPADQDLLLALADLCAICLRQWREFSAASRRPTPAAKLGYLVQAMSRAETADEVARALAAEGSAAADAEFANIAVLEAGSAPVAAHLYHAASLIEDVAERYTTIPVDDSTSLGTVLKQGGEVWLRSLADVGIRYPSLLEDTRAAGLSSTASLALRGRDQRLIGAMGVAWAREQAFTAARKDEVRAVAQLAADALGRAQQLEAERAARQRIEGVQRTMKALVASASLAEVAAAVFDHGLPSFGASAAWLALVSQGQPELLETLHAVGLPEPVLAGWQALPASVLSPAREATETSGIVYVPTSEELAARYPEAHKVIIGSGDQAWAALPLRSGGRKLGALTLAFPRPYPLGDGPGQIVLTALGSAIADALSRAIQHDADHELVELVQHSLLAGRLPGRPGVRLGARYLPAESQYGIGGDWYDAVPLPGGRILLIVGDVAGRGLTAAITMGQMRSAARALAPTHGPADLLEALDRFASSTLEGSLATAAAAIIDPTARTIRYGLAGHPPLLLRAPDGSVVTLGEARRPLLGLDTGARPEQVVSFSSGSFLVLFTDGLVERRGEIFDTGLGRLAAALSAATTTDPVSLGEALVGQVLPPGGRSDDTAILCAFLA